jgi:helicase MOV-10
MLFPTMKDGVIQMELDPSTRSRGWFDDNLNFEQQKAVISICNRNYRCVPYLISGPPGTGKTNTLVETALQLIQIPSSSHILVCAPSDSAADTLVARVGPHLQVHQLLRLNAPTRNFIEILENLRKYCFNTAMGEVFAHPEFHRLRVIVTTFQDASLLVHACLINIDLVQFESTVSRDIHPTASAYGRPYTLYWGALLLDEATQAVEPDAIISLSVVSPPSHCPVEAQPLVIMAGDEHQLGSGRQSHHPRLKMSLFTRLFQRRLYNDHSPFSSEVPICFKRGNASNN